MTAHSRCRHIGRPRTTSARETLTLTRQRYLAVHDLLSQGVGLLECARRMGVALNTVKRCARAESADALRRPPHYRRTLVDSYRDHLRRCLAEQPGIPVTHLLAEIREQGYPDSADLLVRYLEQGCADPERLLPTPRRLVAWIMAKPQNLPEHQRRHLHELVTSCPQMTALAALAARVLEFAGLLTRRLSDDLDAWIMTVRADDLPALHRFTDGLTKDYDAVVAGLTLPYSNGPAEGVVAKNQAAQASDLRQGQLLLATQTNLALPIGEETRDHRPAITSRRRVAGRGGRVRWAEPGKAETAAPEMQAKLHCWSAVSVLPWRGGNFHCGVDKEQVKLCGMTYRGRWPANYWDIRTSGEPTGIQLKRTKRLWPRIR